MAKIETPVTELKINKLTKEQYDAIENPSDTELYFVKDEPISYNELVDTPDLKPVATSGSYNDLTNRPVFNGIEMNDTNPMFYGSSTTAATETIKVVSIPSITQLNAGQIIVVQPTITSTVASSSIQLNNFPAYSMRYNNSAVTTSNASYAWNSNFPSVWLFDGTYWVFLAHGIDYNTTYTLSNLMDSGRYTAGSGTYAITRYSLVMQKPDQTWEKITSTNANYSTATTKVVNPNGFILNQIKYYYTTTNYASGALVAANYIYSKYSGIDLRYSTNCGNTPGWVVGQYIYLVGTIHSDGLFYLDPAQWWTTVLPTTNDGKLYIRIGHVTGTYNSSFYEDRPVFFHDGNKLCEYKVADNKQDVLVSGSNIKTVNGNSIVGEGDVHIDSLPNQADNSGKFLTTDGSEASWVDISQVPDQTGFSGKFLTTNGSIASWAELSEVALSGSYNDLSDKPVLTDFTTEAQQAAIDSGITTSLVAKIGTNAANIEGINLKIPREATSSNQLADKAFVDSMVSSLLARYITSNSAGDSFATNAALLAGPYYLDGNLITTSNLNVNDYAMVMEDETHDGKPARYIWSGTQWSFQYVLNNTTFTQAQIDAMNSTITYSKVQDYDAHIGNTTIHVTQANKDTWNAKQDAITGGATTILTADLAANRALGSNVNGKVVVSDTTFTELGYVHGVTSSIQTQLNSKALDSNTVHKTGNESIAGVKTFTDSTNMKYLSIGPEDASSSSIEGGEIKFVGGAAEPNAGKDVKIDRYNGSIRVVGVDSQDNVKSLFRANIEQGTLSGVTPTEDTTNSTQLDTVGARNTKLQGYQTKLSEGTGISFEDNKVSIIQLDKTYTEIGSLTQSSEGVYSGFNATSYVRLALGFTDQFANGSGIFKAKTGSSLSDTQTILCDTATTQHLICLVNGVPSLVGIENAVQLLSTPLSTNTWYWFNIYAEPTNGDITYLCLVDDDYTMEQVATDQTLPWVPYVFVAHEYFLDAFANTSLQVGKDFWGDYWTGEVDLKNSFAQVDGQIVWIYTDLGVVPAKATVDKYGLVRPDDTTITINDGIISYKNTNGYITADDANDSSRPDSTINNIVHKTGDETISGVKTFDSRVRVNNTSSANEPHITFTNKNIVKGDTSPASNRASSIDFAAVSATTGTNTELGYVRHWYNTSEGVNYSQIDIIAIDPDPNHTYEEGNRKNASMYLYTNGTKQFAQLSFEPIDAVSSTSYSFIPTMGWVNDPARSLNVVHRSGTETISGVKTFTEIVNIKDITYDLFDSTASSRYLYFRDKSSHGTGWIETRINHSGVEGESRLRLFAQTYTDNTFTTTVGSVIDVVAQPDGTTYATAPTPDSSSNDIKIATTSWVRTNLNNSIDNTTISKNASDKLQAIGTVNKNTASGSTSTIYDWVGTLAEYESQNVATTHPDWVCYITDDVEGGESVYTKTEQDVMLAEKADVDLSNSTRLTNCILDIPQDVKITLSADKKTAYVEAGSVMYYADGFEQDGTTKKFTKIILDTERVITTGTGTGYFPIVFRYNYGTGGTFLANVAFDYCVSGSTNPGNGYEWYDTTNNIEGYTLNGAISDRSTFPIGMLYRDEDNNLTIAQVYNGFGYIGSTVYAVPGIKYLMPDGLQTGGQLKTTENTTSVLSVVSNPDTVDATQVLLLDSSGLIQRANVWISSTTKPIFTENYTQLWFNPDTNLVYRYRDSSTQSYINVCLVGRFTHNDSTKITDFSTRNAFIAADYNELDGFVEDKILELGYRPTLFAHEWDDKIRNDVQWLRADTFSWQDGKVYKAAYKHLYDDWASGYTIKTDVVAGHTLSYRLAADGHKIVPATYESVVAAIYEDTGIAWYYIIDTTNQRFKLPRTKFGITGLRDTVGNYVAPGLPNITGYLSTGFVQAQEGNGAFSVRLPKLNRNIPSGSDTYQSGWGWNFSASNSNTIYGASTTVQSPATQMYLYFYVGKYTQSALLNTAGMKTETINDKADRNLLNSVPTAQFAQLLLDAGIDTVIASQLPTAENNYTWYRKYKSGWVEQGGRVQLNGTISATNKRVNFPVEMATSKYIASVDNNANVGAVAYVGWESTTGMSVGLASGSSTGETTWEVKGMAAS